MVVTLFFFIESEEDDYNKFPEALDFEFIRERGRQLPAARRPAPPEITRQPTES